MPASKPGWGGRRPGAGAPKGNLNGLKHGLRSRQLRRLAERWARDPQMRAVLAAYARTGDAQRRTAAALALWLRHLGLAEGGTPWDGPPPPPITRRQLMLFASDLAKQAIK